MRCINEIITKLKFQYNIEGHLYHGANGEYNSFMISGSKTTINRMLIDINSMGDYTHLSNMMEPIAQVGTDGKFNTIIPSAVIYELVK